MINKPGRQPTRSEQLQLTALLAEKYPYERVIVHHITEDTPYRLQLEIERGGLRHRKFERIVL